MPTLFEIADDFAALDALLDDSGGEISPAVEEWLADLNRNLEEKADGYARYCAFLDARSKACREEAQRLSRSAHASDQRRKWLAGKFVQFMQTRGVKKIETTLSKLTVCNNGGRLPLIVEDESRLPEECVRYVRVPVEDEIRSRLESGTGVPGARLGERGVHLRIR